MRATRFLAFILAWIFALSLVACDSNDNKPIETANESTAEEESTTVQETTGNKEPEIVEKTYKVTEVLDKLKVFGRTSKTANGLACDFSASGIEFNAYVEGKLTVTVTVAKGGADAPLNDDCYFTLYVDGVRSETRFKAAKAATTTLELADFATGGVHNIRLVKQTEAKQALAELSTIYFKGYFENAPAPAKYFVEFLGDSLTCGYGNLAAKGTTAATAQLAVNQDATQAFAYMTAQRLGADHSMVSASGIGVVKGFRSFTMSTLFDANSHYRSTTATYQPARVPDFVVINLGTNDMSASISVSQADWQAGVSALITQVRTAYGKDVPIVWVYNMMNTNATYPQTAQNAINALGGESAGLYMCKVTNNTGAGAGHPSLEGHKTAAIELTSFILDKKILK